MFAMYMSISLDFEGKSSDTSSFSFNKANNIWGTSKCCLPSFLSLFPSPTFNHIIPFSLNKLAVSWPLDSYPGKSLKRGTYLPCKSLFLTAGATQQVKESDLLPMSLLFLPVLRFFAWTSTTSCSELELLLLESLLLSALIFLFLLFFGAVCV